MLVSNLGVLYIYDLNIQNRYFTQKPVVVFNKQIVHKLVDEGHILFNAEVVKKDNQIHVMYQVKDSNSCSESKSFNIT